MKRIPRGLSCVFFLLILGVPPIHAAVFHRAGLDWHTQQSEHFQIHFHDGLQSEARRVLDIAEQVHQRLSGFIQWQPQERTEIVLTDEYDVSNGYASPYPANRMTLYLSSPDEISGLEDYGDWLELVFTHEYLHILHLDKASGTPESLRSVFGRFLLLFPNAFQPAWFTEGLATYVETDTTRGIGRGQSSYYDMQMRMEVLSGLKPLRQVNQPMASWPMGTVPYLYGVHFYNFLAERYGEEEIRQLVDSYSNNIIPFLINANSYQVLGKELDPLWLEFSDYLNERYRRQLEEVYAEGETLGQPLTRRGYFAGPVVAGEEGTLFYIAFDAMRNPALMSLVPGREPERLADVGFGSRLAIHPQQGLLLAQPELCNNATYYYDLYRYDHTGGNRQRLTHCARYRMAEWLPLGDGIVAVHNSGGQNALHRLDADGKQVAVLWQGKKGEVISHIAVSPDGRHIVASLWRAGQGWDLALFDLASSEWSELTHTTAIENHPHFSDDGKTILYTADYEGIYNVQRLTLGSGQIERLTNVVGGAFYPQLSGDGSELTYVGYSAEGFDLYRLPLAPDRAHSVVPESGAGALSAPPSPTVATDQIQDYSPWESLRPRWWFPIYYADDDRRELGLLTGGSDTLQRHNYALGLGYDLENSRGFGSADYLYDRFTPIFKLHLDNSYEDFRNSEDELQKVRAQRNVQAEVVLPWLRQNYHWSLHLGVAERRESDVRVEQSAWAEPTLRDRLAGLSLVYTSAMEFPRGISPVDGREIMLTGEDSGALPGSDYNGRAHTLDWKEFIRLGGEHVLGVRLLGAQGENGIRPFNLGGTAEVNLQPGILDSPIVNSPFNRRRYALRGYEEHLPELTGTNIRLASAEYRFPIIRLERGFMAPPVGLHQLHGALFAETGAAWFEGGEQDDYYGSYGAELKADTVLFYGFLARLSLGYAHGIADIGEDQVYLRFGGAF